MPRPKLNVVVLDPGSGKARPGAWVSFYVSNTSTLASLYADDDVSSLANPVQANGLGQVAVRINPGLYDISMTWDGAQPTVVEDVLAYTPESAVLTQRGDMIISDDFGNPVRLPHGLENQLLITANGLPTWTTMGIGRGLPYPGQSGSLVAIGPGQWPAVPQNAILIPPGLQDQALAMAGGVPTWVSTLLPPGTTLPISQPGDLVVGAVSSGAPARLARGNPGDVLTSDGSGVSWQAGGEVARGVGQCRLHLFDATTVGLQPLHGENIWINGGSRKILEGSFPVLSRAGLSLNTQYLVYAAWTGSAIVLEASTTQWEGTGGLVHKMGDPSRTLVGMIYTTGTTEVVFTDTPAARHVLSYFNQFTRHAEGFFTAPRSLNSQTIVEVHTEIRSYFLTWPSAVEIALDGTVSVPPNGHAITYLALDGLGQTVVHNINHTPFDLAGNLAQTRSVTPAPGRHYLTLLASTTPAEAGACTWVGDINNVGATRTHALFSG